MPTIVDMRPPANTFRHATLIVIWLDGEIGRRPRFKLWCPEMDVWVRIPLKLLIIKGRRIYERTIRRIKETV